MTFYLLTRSRSPSLGFRALLLSGDWTGVFRVKVMKPDMEVLQEMNDGCLNYRWKQ